MFGVLIGASSLLAGYLFHQLSQMRSKELSYLQLVPQFTNLKKLRDHLSGCPEQTADVLVEGVVKMGKDGLKSDKAGVEGAAKLVTTTSYKKVYNQQSEKWSESTNTIENQRISIPFHLTDKSGNTITVQSIHNAGGFRQILERVWQEKVAPDSRSLGDYATSTVLKEIPNGSHTSELLLVFGSSLGAYGTATLQNKSLLTSGNVVFTPSEVSSSIEGLISRNEIIVSTLKFFSMVFLLGGGGILLLSMVPLAMKALGYRKEEGRSRGRLTVE